MERITRYKVTGLVLVCLLVACAAFVMTATPRQAHAVKAYEIKALPFSTQTVDNSTRLNLKASNLTVKWGSGMTGRKITNVNDRNGYDSFQVKREKHGSTSKGYTFNNLCTFTFGKAGSIDGNPVYVQVKIDSLTINKGDDYKNKDWLEIGETTPGGLALGSYNKGYYTKEKWKMKISVQVKYSGGSKEDQIVPYQCFQAIRDIDMKDEGEAWQMGSGFTGGYIRYSGKDTCSSKEDSGPHNAFDVTLDKDSGKFSGKYTSNIKETEAHQQKVHGFYATTNNGSFSQTYYGAYCMFGMRIYSSYSTDKDPTKVASTSYAKPGDTFTWSVSRPVGTFVKNLMTPYSQIKFWDYIDPTKMEYVSAKMYSGSSDVTNQGTLWRSGDTVNFEFGDTWRKNLENYKGQTLKLVITVKLKETTGTVKNTGYVTYYPGSDKSATATMRAKAPVRYYTDGSDTPVYTDYATWDDAYQVNSNATKAATRSDCSGLDGWYLGSFGSSKYSPTAPGESGLNLYAKNWVDVRYAVTDTSYQKTHPNKSYYLDKTRNTKLTSDSQILPSDSVKQFHCGDTVTFGKGKDLYYKRQGKTRTLKPSDGVYATADASGDLFESSPVYANTTVYIDWKNESYYDGVYSS